MSDQLTQVLLTIDSEADDHDEGLADLTRQLRHELMEIDVEDVELARAGTVPEGAKAVSPEALSELLYVFRQSGHLELKSKP